MSGFKQFVTDTALTDSDLNGYLMSQTVMTFANASARSAAISTPTEGMCTYLKDTDSVEVYDGTSWLPINVGAWTAYTPTLSAATTSPTLGTGGSAVGRYQQQGKTVRAKGIITFGSSGQNFGSGNYSISLPVTSRTGMSTSFGTCVLVPTGTSSYVMGWCPNGSATISLYAPNTTTTSATSAMGGTSTPGGIAWSANAQIRFDLTYEAA